MQHLSRGCHLLAQLRKPPMRMLPFDPASLTSDPVRMGIKRHSRCSSAAFAGITLAWRLQDLDPNEHEDNSNPVMPRTTRMLPLTLDSATAC